ncbi:MAG: TylF/MycF/NovP-related O-methyltransferase, partial [Rhizomicrobium sp.]
FKEAMKTPGYFVEIGVYKGAGLLTWAKLIDMHCPGDRMRRVVGFDNFAGFTSFHEKDGAPAEQGNKVIGGWNPSGAKDDLQFFIDAFQVDRFLPHASLIEIVDGDLNESAARWAQANPGLRIALLNLDVDLYEPTLATLKALYPMVSPGGVVLIDEYGAKDFPGPALAVQDYFGGKMPKLHKPSLYTAPGAYFIKE